MKNYVLRTDKSWAWTTRELENEFKLWEITEWDCNVPKGAVREGFNQSEEDRTVILTYKKEGKTVTLKYGKQARAVDNLRAIFLTVQSLRRNELRGMDDLFRSAYLQLEAPESEKDPYEVLNLYRGAPLSVCEAMFKELAKEHHPDRGGDQAKFKELNDAIEKIRKAT